MSVDIECVVVGAGVVGLAVARALARSGRDVILVEAGEGIGVGISSRNSEVNPRRHLLPERQPQGASVRGG